MSQRTARRTLAIWTGALVAVGWLASIPLLTWQAPDSWNPVDSTAATKTASTTAPSPQDPE